MSHQPAPRLPAWIQGQLPSSVRRYVVPVEGQRMHVMEMGMGRPVLMLHGNPSWSFLYRRVMSELVGEPLRLVVPDLIGLGLSSKPRDPGFHTIPVHGRCVARLVDTLELEDFIAVGQDWGGPIMLHALHQLGGGAAGMVVLNTVVGPPKPGFRATAFHRFSQLPVVSDLAFRGLGFPQNLMFPAQGDKSSIRGKVAKAYRWPLRKFKNRTAPLALARMVPDSPEHFSIPALQECLATFEAFGGPMSIVWGDRDPVLGSVRSYIERLKPAAEVTRTKAGHFLQEEVPEDIAAAVRSVAARLAAGAETSAG